MSQHAVETILGRLITDGEFRKTFLGSKDDDRLRLRYNSLTGDEIDALMAIDSHSLELVAGALASSIVRAMTLDVQAGKVAGVVGSRQPTRSCVGRENEVVADCRTMMGGSSSAGSRPSRRGFTDEPLTPMVGFANGLLISVVLWITVGAGVWVLLP